MRQRIKQIPVLGPLANKVYVRLVAARRPFPGSTDYWIARYESGGTSGDGSYNQLAQFKAEVLNQFVADHHITSIIEYGSGDGNQLTLADYPRYLGFDISPRAVALCRERFAEDPRLSFKTTADYDGETAELTLSLDVVYHLVEDAVFAAYMARLFDSATRYVIVYSSDTDDNPPGQSPHVRHRAFTRWVADNRPAWRLIDHIPNRYPYAGDTKTGSFADFYIFAPAGGPAES